MCSSDLIRGPNGSGKSTCLHSLRGTIPLLGGERKVNPDLRLGVFTQDLAQELDVNARAVDLVLDYARNGPDGDIFVSEQSARDVLGRLGLRGEKPLNRVGDLSGGEKARVALAMFASKASNVYLLDEISNHLDIESVAAVGESLQSWDENKIGAVVVVSHDENLCGHIDFTHVATVSQGKFTVEQRSARPSDWIVGSLSETAQATSAPTNEDSTLQANIDPKIRKQAFNAPKRIAKLEKLIAEAEEKITSVEAEMLENGSDVGKLVDLTSVKEELEAKVLQYMDEWEELETILEQVK